MGAKEGKVEGEELPEKVKQRKDGQRKRGKEDWEKEERRKVRNEERENRGRLEEGEGITKKRKEDEY